MTLPWFRVDSNIGTHDKIIALTGDHSSLRYRAAFAYICAIGWSVSAGTDGRIPTGILPMIHADKRIADLLVKYQLWHTDVNGYQIHNYSRYQVMSRVLEEMSEGGRKGACIRWHGPGCWGPDGCSQT